MGIPIIGDYKQPKLNNTEKAVSMLLTEIEMLKNWNQGLQRQIAGLCLHLNVSPNQFSVNTRKQDDINNFLQEAQNAEELMMKAEQTEQETKALEALKVSKDENNT